MESRTGFCGDGCSFDSVDIDCSMAFRMVEATMKRIMAGMQEGGRNDFVFAGLIKPDDAVSVVVNPQHRLAQSSSSIHPRTPSNISHWSRQSPSLYSSTAPLLGNSKRPLPDLEALSLEGSPQASSTPFSFPRRKEKIPSHFSTRQDTNPAYPLSSRIPSPKQLGSSLSASYSELRHSERASRSRPKGVFLTLRLYHGAGQSQSVDNLRRKHFSGLSNFVDFSFHRASCFQLTGRGCKYCPSNSVFALGWLTVACVWLLI
jgi:hypothetical protein